MDVLQYDKGLEDVVLGSAIVNEGEYEIISSYFVDKEVFYQTNAQLLWEKLVYLKNKGLDSDTMSICSSLSKKDTDRGLNAYYITGCTTNACVKGLTKTHASQLYEKYLLRKIIVKTEKIKIMASENHCDVYDTISTTHTLLGELIQNRPSTIETIDDIIDKAMESIENNEDKLIKTGYGNLDRFSGGLTRGEVSIVGGRPGHGKTTVLINLLSHTLKQGHKAMFFSRELPSSELLKKIMCLESEQLSYSMVRKNIYTEQEMQILKETITYIKKMYNEERFLIFDNLKDFASSSSEAKKFKPDIIFDDYIQLIAHNGKEEQRRLQIEKLCNDYKWLAKDIDCAVVIASQLNRGIEFRNTKTYEPQLSDLAESGAIEQVAENVFFTYYDYKVKGDAGKGKNTLTISASKVRYGDTGKVDLGYDGDKCKIYNSIEEMIKTDEIPF